MSVNVDFYWDIGSTNTYFAFRMLPGVLARTGATVTLHPFNLGYVFRQNEYVLMDEPVAKMRNRKRDLERWAEHLHLPFQVPRDFPIKTSRALRSALVAKEQGVEAAFLDHLFRTYWEEGTNIAEYAQLEPIIARVAVDPAGFIERAESDEIKQKLIESTQNALQRGVFGAPMMVVGDEMFWGKDRMDFLEREIRNRMDELD